MTTLDYTYAETILSARNVSKSLGGSLVLRDVNMEIKDVKRPGMTQGQVVALLGPSGMGKTTLFRILAGLDRPDSGQVLLGTENHPVRRGQVGVIAQHYPLFAHRTVLGNLTVAGKQAGLSGKALTDKAMNLLLRFGLEDQARKYPAQLSGGQRQRAAIAQQFMCSEHFLLMDEPFSGLDPLAKARVCEFITEMAATDEMETFIVVTHDIIAAAEVADHVWLLGRDRDAQGQPIPGARVQAEYDLIERGLAWHKDVTNLPAFTDLLREIRAAFARL